MPDRAVAGSDAVLDHHPRPARRPRHRRPSGGIRAPRRWECTSRSRRWTNGSGGRPSPAPPPPRSRLEAVRRLAEAGIDVGVGMAPILPGLSDRPEQLEEVVREDEPRARGASGRTSSTSAPEPASTSSQRSPRTGPEEVGRYEQLYAHRAYLPSETAKTLTEPVRRGSVRSLTSPQARRAAGAGATRSRRLTRHPEHDKRRGREADASSGFRRERIPLLRRLEAGTARSAS